MRYLGLVPKLVGDRETALLLGLSFAFSLFPSCCGATSIAPPRDFSAASPSGEFSAEAKVQSTRHHRIEMKRMPAGELLWSAEQDPTERFLVEMIATDGGCLVVQSLHGDYSLFTAAGKRGPIFDLALEIPEEERKTYGGPDSFRDDALAHRSQAVWIDAGGSWFYFRTYWGRIVAVDCSNGEVDRDPALLDRIENSLINDARSWINSAPSNFLGKCPRCGESCIDASVVTRLLVIRSHRLAGGEPFILLALGARLRGHDEDLEACLNRLYNPDTLSERLRPFFPVALVAALLFGFFLITRLRRRVARLV